MEYDDRRYYYRKDLPIADWLMSFRDKLAEEFLARNPDYFTGDYAKGFKMQYPATGFVFEAWVLDRVKVSLGGNVIYDPDNPNSPEVPDELPTACHIARELGEHCPILTYSTLEPNTVLERHICPDNYESKYLRIHVPLIIPEGDIWFECEGEEIDWRDIWAFNNQYVHSAFNFSNTRRLILMVDVSREYLGIKPASPFNKERYETEFKKPYYKHLPRQNVIKKWNYDTKSDARYIEETFNISSTEVKEYRGKDDPELKNLYEQNKKIDF